MSGNQTHLIFIVLASSLAILALLPGTLAQSSVTPDVREVELGNISGAVVTLYYYDPVTETRGEKVDIPENPQVVQWDESKAAPGTYTFTRVPEGTYYLEAVHGNNSWFAIAIVYKGTTTANVAIPLNRTGQTPVLEPVNITPAQVPVTITAQATQTPTAVVPDTYTSSPGLSVISAIAGLCIIAVYLICKKEQ